MPHGPLRASRISGENFTRGDYVKKTIVLSILLAAGLSAQSKEHGGGQQPRGGGGGARPEVGGGHIPSRGPRPAPAQAPARAPQPTPSPRPERGQVQERAQQPNVEQR